MTVEMKKYKLGDILVNHDRRRIPLSSKVRSGRKGNFRYYGAQGVVDYIDDYIFDGEYVLIAEDGENLRSRNQNVANLVSGQFWVNNHAHIVTTNEKCDLHYFYYAFNFLQIDGYISGSAQPKLSQDSLNRIEMTIPDLQTQKGIASFLFMIDKRIENLRAQNRVLEQTAKTIYDYTFLQCAGHQTTYNKTLNRNIPEDWEVKRLGDLVSVSKESLNPQNYPEKQFKHFSIPSFDDNGSYSLEYGKDIFSNKFIVNNNHVLISKLNPWKNRAVWCDENDDAIGSTEFVTLLPRKLENKAFVFSIVKSDSFIEYCSDAATGTSHSHRRVSPDIMMKFPIAYDEKTVTKFNAHVTPLFKKQLVNTKQIEALTTQRNTLLPLLMTGQITIK